MRLLTCCLSWACLAWDGPEVLSAMGAQAYPNAQCPVRCAKGKRHVLKRMRLSLPEATSWSRLHHGLVHVLPPLIMPRKGRTRGPLGYGGASLSKCPVPCEVCQGKAARAQAHVVVAV